MDRAPHHGARAGARVVLLEADICGGGPSGRNGGFVTNWWDEFPTLLERYGADGARSVGEAIEAAVDEVGTFCAAHGIDAWYTKAGSLSASAAPAQDGAWDEAVEALRGHGLDDRLVPLSAAEVAARVRSPVFRDGRVHAWRGHRATGGARAGSAPRAARAWRGDRRRDRRQSRSTANDRAPSVASGRARDGRRARRGATAGRAPRPSASGRRSDGGDGEVLAGSRGARAERLGGRLAVVRAGAS